ncbi:MMPL family transporter [Microbispora bryophytorum]|uniref:Membrane protein n=1 Tax=Microbispora bryophytorum TaxID=1460882 RepID=A0A8H9H1D5_9ACTN|nr:MMPL family transporter [Microbispora bryophytorum]MBD3136451.1 MMPL family transporter [Microbispora bryophytorum]TQS01698.1 MMPL family transporter [Microbispora bryophytorum]GGO18954.1 membrane protein [Microbispora bryophytorum]
MFERWGRTVYRRRRLVLVLSAIVVVAAAVWGLGVFGTLTSSGEFDVAGSESQRAAQLETAALGRDEADVVVLYRSRTSTVDDPAYGADVTRALQALPAGHVDSFATYWSTKSPQFVSADRKSTFAVLRLRGEDEHARRDHLAAIRTAVAVPGLESLVGGSTATQKMISDGVKKDIVLAEGIATPLLLLLMIFIFGSVVAAGLPLLIGVVAVFGSFSALHLFGLFTNVSTYAVNITTLLGVGLAIDYGLFMVVRFREELNRGRTGEEAVVRTMATAGRTVAVSGVTVAASLASLLIFPQSFLRSMGMGGLATVLVDMVAALTIMPALLAVLGPRVNALAPRWLARRQGRQSLFWARLGRGVMRRPVVVLVGTLAILVTLGLPFLRVSWGGIDARALPAGTETRVVSETMTDEFPANFTNPLRAIVTLSDPVSSPAARAALSAYTGRVEAVPGITGAQLTGEAGRTARIELTYSANRMSAEARDVVRKVRAVPPPAGASVLVGGATAALVDQLANLGDLLPWMALLVGVTTFLLLFMAFGSILLPIKAVIMNIFSLSATFGALVWIFQDGHLSGLLGFTPTGFLEPSMPILVLAIVFGLSMDYEVFLLSRMREHYDAHGDNTAAVAAGLQRTGGLITSAALLFIIVVAAFSTSGITFIKLTGIGMLIAVLVDSTIVRALLVPATMKLTGRANWWAPGPLRRLYGRYGIRESDEAVVPESTLVTR